MKAMTSSSYANRWVVALTPLVFAPLAGSICVLAARYLPGVDIDKTQVEAIFIAGATIAFGKAGLWLKGWQDHEKRDAGAVGDAPAQPDAPADTTASGPPATESTADTTVSGPPATESPADTTASAPPATESPADTTAAPAADVDDLPDPHAEPDLDDDPDDAPMDGAAPLAAAPTG